MKKLIIVFLSCLGLLSARAQTYYPFPDSGAVWTVFFEYQSSPTNYSASYWIYELGGDTVIGAYTYNKITGSNGTIGGIRNDSANQKVYFAGDFEQNSYTDTILYDFSLNVGDTAYFDMGQSQWITVSAVDSVLIQGNYHKRISLNVWSNDEWVTGIGSLSTPFAPLTFEFEWNNTLNCLQDNTTMIYQRGMFPTSCTAWHGWVPAYCGLTSVAPVGENDFSVLLQYREENLFSVSIKNAEGDCLVEIYDATGKKVRENSGIQSSIEMDLQSIAPGLYVLKVMDESGKAATQKFLVR
jgi:hypothetical protein